MPSCEKFFVKELLDQKVGRRIPRTLPEIAKYSLQKLRIPFWKVTNGREQAHNINYNSRYQSNNQPITRAETTETIGTKPPDQSAHKSPLSFPDNFGASSKRIETKQSDTLETTKISCVKQRSIRK